MPRRTLLATNIRCHPKHKRGTDIDHDVAALPGSIDLLDHFEDWLTRLDQIRLRDEKREVYGTSTNHARINRMLFIKGRMGAFGEADHANVNVDTDRVVHSGTEREAATIPVRAILYVPPVGKDALLLTEEAGRTNLGAKLLKLYSVDWLNSFSDITLQTSSVVERDAWLETAELTEIAAFVRGWSSDPDDMDADARLIGNIKHTVLLDDGVLFAPIVNRLKESKLHRGQILGLDDELVPDDIRATVEGQDGRKKTFSIDSARTPVARLVMSEAGDTVLEDKAFIQECEKHAKDLFAGLGSEWQTEWGRPSQQAT